VISFAVWARCRVQGHAAIRPEGSAEDYHSNDAVNRSQHIDKVGSLKDDSRLSRENTLRSDGWEVCDLDPIKNDQYYQDREERVRAEIGYRAVHG
jgi:hypothetical protein